VIVVFFFGCTPGAKKSDQKATDKKTENVDPLMEKAKAMFGTLPAVATSSENVSTKEKVLLGKILYFDNRLSKNNTQSCNTCHDLDTYGVDNLPTSPGDNGIPGTRNSPTVLNAALHTTQFWDGRDKTIEDQAGGPILNPDEMAIPNKQFLIDRLSKIDEYKTLFAQAFPDESKPITYPNIQKAIGVFERELMTPSRFDDYLAGNVSSLTKLEKEGLETFINTGCITCHIGNVLGEAICSRSSDYMAIIGIIPIANQLIMAGLMLHKRNRINMFSKFLHSETLIRPSHISMTEV
ncbi:MAG: cytochrome-c peroxidase, partial [Bacteroidales bacterium]|nr:cytochrome-c peroxidase [Bacteroidales bacterium]